MKELKLDDLMKVAGGGGDCGYDKNGGGKNDGGKGKSPKHNKDS